MRNKTSIVTSAADCCGQPLSIRSMDNSPSRDHKEAEYKESFMLSSRLSVSRGSILAITAFAAAALALAGLASTASASIIYQDSFDRTGALNASTSAPTDTNNATWTAASLISTSTTSGGYANLPSNTWGTAYLPFTPVNGNIYTLIASLNPITGTTTNWLAFGFLTAGNVNTSTPNMGAWIGLLERDNRGSQVFNGDGGSANGPTSPNNPGYTTWSITLNTTQPDWTASFSEVGVSGESNFQTFTYTGATGGAPNPAITAIGFGNDDLSGMVQNFMLSSVPEPATLGLVAVGGLGLMLLKRRKAL